ncbi:MAG TPA: hypothetical protein VIL30_18225, partial [Ramlibacter sp.]
LRQFTFTWRDIRLITAAYGRQHYGMTRCIESGQRRGIDLFLPENDPCFSPFLTGAAQNLPGLIPELDWSAWVAENPKGAITIWKRKLFGWF